MASQKTKFTVGLFVASGIGIGIMAVIWLGMSRVFERGQYYVTYFNESVQGLEIDSPVKYRGVSIGRVKSIGVAPDSKLIQVVLKVESGKPLDSQMVAQLALVGITGSLFIELDRRKEGEPDRSPDLNFPSEYPIVASTPSDMGKLFQSINDVMERIKFLDLEGVSEKTKVLLESINRMIDDANVKGISMKLEYSLEHINQILDSGQWKGILTSLEEASRSVSRLADSAIVSLNRVEGILEESEAPIKAALEDLRKASHNADVLVQRGTQFLDRTDDSLAALQMHLQLTLQNLEIVSENLKQFSELLSEQPSELLFSKPPPPRKIELE